MKAVFRLFCFCLMLGVSPAIFAQDCGGPLVKFGEVRAGFQAGFVAGRLIDTIPDEATGEPEPLADGFWRGHAGYDQRGFIDVESNSGWLCEGDWALVSSWFGLPETVLNLGLSPAELRM